MFFELRTYDLKPGKAPVYLEFFRTFGLELVTRHLPMGGYWMTESGPLNRIEHLWIYEDFAERDACRASLIQDRPWMEEFIPKAFADVLAQSTRIMTLVESSPAFGQVISARKTHHANQAVGSPMFADALQGLTVSDHAPDRSGLIAGFRVLSGTNPGSHVALHGGSFDALTRMTDGADSHALLRPLTFSPLR